MSNLVQPLNEYVAGALSDMAYTPISTTVTADVFAKDGLLDWTDITDEIWVQLGGAKADAYYSPDQKNEFRVFKNADTKQIVFTFKGSDNISNLLSDLNLNDQGWTAYKSIRTNAQKYFKYVTLDAGSEYAGYSIFADGHSLGGGMAQTFALENNISGYGQNSLPISSTAMTNLWDASNPFQTALASYRANLSLKFTEVNVAGDIATGFYSKVLNQQYISTTPRTLDSSYAGAEDLAKVLGVFLPFVGVAIAGGAGIKAHLLSSYLPLIGAQGYALSGPTPSPDQIAAINNAVASLSAASLDDTGPVTVTTNSGFTASVEVPAPAVLSGNGKTLVERAGTDLNPILFGSDGNSLLIGGASNDILIGGFGDSTLVGGAGNDTLIGGLGNSTLIGGSGIDRYEFLVAKSGPATVETIKDHADAGTVWVGDEQNATDTQLEGGQAVQGENFTWIDGDGTTYKYAADTLQDIGGGTGTLTITQGALGAGGQIVIEDFDFNKAQSQQGYLGIKLGSEKLALETDETRNSDPFAAGNFFPDNVTQATNGALQTFTIFASKISDQAQQVVVSAAGAASNLGINLGDGFIPFSNGPITLTIPAGEDSVTVALVNTGDGKQAVTANLTATLQDPNNTGVTSNELDITFASTNNSADAAKVTPDKTIVGDLNPMNFGTASAPVYRVDELGNTIVNPADPNPGLNDWLNGSAGNDLIKTGDGNNIVIASQGGNDNIVGGSGDDYIRAGAGNNTIVGGGGNNMIGAGTGSNTITGGSGNDNISVSDDVNGFSINMGNRINGGGDNKIEGKGGQDIIRAGNGNNRIYADSEIEISTAISNSGSGQGTGNKGSLIAVGNGNNTIVGGSGNDGIFVGNGNNLVVLGAGNDTFTGGDVVTGVGTDWSASLQNNNVQWNKVLFEPANTYTVPAGWNNQQYSADVYGKPAGTGDDTIFGGAGNSLIVTSNGDNYVDAGPGNTTVQGGGGNDTIFAGNGNGVIWGGGGDDYIDAEDGNHIVIGGQGDNTLYGGAGNDTIFAGDDGVNWYKAETGDNYVEGGSGDSIIYGSGGNDTLIAGSGNSTIYGGSGDEYIEGGSGNSELHSNSGTGTGTDGSGSDTLVAGDGNATIYGWKGNDTIYGGDGIDVIHGGDGTQEIYSGDGGTADNATQITVGSGDTTVYGGSGYLQVTGGSGNDTLIAGDGDTTLMGGSGTELLYAGAGNSLLIGGSGSDTLYSGQGSSTLMGGSGQTVYEIDADAGDVLVEPAGPSDRLVFGTGISVADLSMTGSLDADGNQVLEIDLPDGGVVSILGGLDANLSQFTFTDSSQSYSLSDLLQAANSYANDVAGPNGDLVFSAASGDVLQGTPSGNDTLVAFGADSTLIGGNGNETFMVYNSTDVVQAQAGGTNTIQSTVGFTASANVQNLVGTGTGNLALAAADGYNQTITANDGNDTLMGALGNDTLVGGAGLDTFMLGKNTGSSIAVDNSTKGAIVQLASGLALSDLSASRLGNDLLLRVNGAASSMRLQDYFTASQSWMIEDSAGNTTTPLNLLAATSDRSALQASQLWEMFSTQLKTDLSQMYRNAGWTLQANGTFTTGYQIWPAYGYGYQTTVETRSLFIPYDPYGFTFNRIQDLTTWNYSSAWLPEWTNNVSSILVKVSPTNGAVVYADAAAQSTSSSRPAWFNMSWTTLSVSVSTWGAVAQPYNWMNADGVLYYVLPTVANTTQRTLGQGSITGISLTPVEGNMLLSGLPTVTNGTYDQNNAVNEIQEIQLSPGDHTVYANANTMVVGGDGNSQIYDAGLAFVSSGDNFIYNANTAYGGAGNDTMIFGGTLIGGSGNETMIAGNTMIAGTGNDQIFAGTTDATIRINANSAGIDLVGGDGDSVAFLDAYYQSIGIADWQQRYQSGGMYALDEGGTWTKEGLLNILTQWNGGKPVSLQQALASGGVTYIEPLPVLLRAPGLPFDASAFYGELGTPAVQIAANDFAALAQYDGSAPAHRLVFGSGITRDQLTFSWGTANASMSGFNDDPTSQSRTVSLHTTLNISWGSSGVVQVLIPQFDDPVGSGVTEFDFADGSKMSLSDMIALAPPAPTFDPQLQDFVFQSGTGEQVLGSSFKDVQFAGLNPSQLSVSRDGSDLILAVSGSNDAVRLTGWYYQQFAYSKFQALFADGTSWNESSLSAMGLIENGSAGNQTLTGLYGYANTLIAGPNDTLVGGGSGLDTYVFNAGSGTVRIQDSSGSGTIQFGAGITPDQISLGLGSLMLRVGSNGDTIHIDNFDPQDALGSSGISTFRFADGSVLTLDQLLGRGFDIYGTTGDEVLSGTNVSDRIYAGSGNDTLIGGQGNDTLIAGAGVDTFQFWSGDGQDVIDETAKAGLASGTDSVDFSYGISAGDLLFNSQNGNVVIARNGSDDTLIVKNVQAIGKIQFADGSYDVYQDQGNDSASITTYAADGSVLQVAQQTFDGKGNATTVNYDANGFVLGSNQQTSDGLGNTEVTYFDSDGIRLSDTWTHADGTKGADTFNADGSSSGTINRPDGSFSNYTNDGQGTQTIWNFDLNGNSLGYSVIVVNGNGGTDTTDYDGSGNQVDQIVTWSSADGSYGSDTYYPDDSGKGQSYYPNGLDGYFNGAVSDTYSYDGLGHANESEFDPNGMLLGKVTTSTDYATNYQITTLFDPAGSKLSDFWSSPDGYGHDTFNADGSSIGESHSNADSSYNTYVNDGSGKITTQNFDTSGNLLGSVIALDDGRGDTSTANFDANGVKLNDSWTQANGTTGSDVFNGDGSIKAIVNYSYSDGSTYSTDTITQTDGSYQQTWNKSDGSTGSTNYNAATGEVTGSNATAGAGYSYTYDNTQNLGGVSGVTESVVNYTYADGSTYSTDTIAQADGSYQQSWSKSDGSAGSTNVDAVTGEVTGSNATAGAGYSYTYDNTQNVGGVSGVTESAVNYTYDDGTTYATDTVSETNGSYQQSWSKSDGSTGSTNVDAATGEVTGSNATVGAGYSYTYDNTQNVGGVSGVTESKVDYTYADGSTYATDTVSNPNGSYQQSWAKSDGSTGATNYNAVTGEVTGSNATAGAGYSYTYDNTQNVGGVVGVTESKVAYTYADGSIYNTDTVSDPNGSYQQTWSKSDGSTGSTSYDAATGEVTGSNAAAGAGYSYSYDNTQNVGEVSGVTESKVNYAYVDGTTYGTDTVSDPNGSYQQSWSNSDGSTGSTNYNAVTGEVTGSNATAGVGYSYTYDNTNLDGGTTESRVNYTYADGSTYSTDTVSHPGGSYEQSWSKSDGSAGATNYNAATGEVTGSNATAGAGYSYTYDNTVLGGGVTESKVNYAYADGTSYATDTISNPDGSYFQGWSKSDGTAGSSAVNAYGTLTGDSWAHADGTQGVDAGGNHLLLSGAGNDALSAQAGNDLLIGGAGNDAITTGSGTNLIAFNAGDGNDAVYASSGQNNVLSLGGNFAYSDLALERNGADLILDVGGSDSITFKGWYAGNQNIVDLQVVESAMADFNPGSTDALRNSRIETFDFQSVVNAFDQASASNPSLSAWGITNALLDAHLSSSDTAALGGDLAAVYGASGSLAGFGVAAAQATLSSSQFASAAQSLSPWPTLNGGAAQIK